MKFQLSKRGPLGRTGEVIDVGRAQGKTLKANGWGDFVSPVKAKAKPKPNPEPAEAPKDGEE